MNLIVFDFEMVVVDYYYYCEQFYSAIDFLKEIIIIRPKNHNDWARLAICYKKIGEVVQCIQALKNAIQDFRKRKI